MSKAKPILLLDVDGVINYVGDGGAWRDQKEKMKLKRVNWWNIRWSTEVVLKINYWGRNLADIRWLTSWDEKARLLLAPALGIDEFPLARDPSMWHKAHAADIVDQTYPGIPICWIDDELDSFLHDTDRGHFYWESRPNTLLIQPSEKMGLQPDDLARIESFLIEHSK